MSKLSRYADNQRSQYDLYSKTLEAAKAQVAPDYDQMRRVADAYGQLVLSQYFLRRGQFYQPGMDLSNLKLLDFGCGVGRVMEVFSGWGCQVDGCDISREIMKHAAANPALAGARFFVSGGTDVGDAPANHYDIAYSFLCMHHIPMRQTRIKILEALAGTLVDDGMVFIEMKIFPGATPAKVPVNHAHWAENMVARETNSKHDVWITTDALGLVYEDFRLFFEDVAILEVDTGSDHFHFDESQIYQMGFNEIFVLASKNRTLRQRLLTLD